MGRQHQSSATSPGDRNVSCNIQARAIQKSAILFRAGVKATHFTIGKAVRINR